MALGRQTINIDPHIAGVIVSAAAGRTPLERADDPDIEEGKIQQPETQFVWTISWRHGFSGKSGLPGEEFQDRKRRSLLARRCRAGLHLNLTRRGWL